MTTGKCSRWHVIARMTFAGVVHVVGCYGRPLLADQESVLTKIAPSLTILKIDSVEDTKRQELNGFKEAYGMLHQGSPDYKGAHTLFLQRIRDKNPADPYLPYDYGWALVSAVGENNWEAAGRYYEYLVSIRWPVYIIEKVKVDFRKQMREALASAQHAAPHSKGAALFYEKFKNIPFRISIPVRGVSHGKRSAGSPE